MRMRPEVPPEPPTAGASSYWAAWAAANNLPSIGYGATHPTLGMWRAGRVHVDLDHNDVGGEWVDFDHAIPAFRYFRQFLLYVLDDPEEPISDQDWKKLHKIAQYVVVPEPSVLKIAEREFVIGDMSYFCKYMEPQKMLGGTE